MPFVLLKTPHTGSTFLSNLLSSLPRVFCTAEALTGRQVEKTPPQFLARYLRAALVHRRPVGRYANATALFLDLHDETTRRIILRRTNGGGGSSSSVGVGGSAGGSVDGATDDLAAIGLAISPLAPPSSSRRRSGGGTVAHGAAAGEAKSHAVGRFTFVMRTVIAQASPSGVKVVLVIRSNAVKAACGSASATPATGRWLGVGKVQRGMVQGAEGPGLGGGGRAPRARWL